MDMDGNESGDEADDVEAQKRIRREVAARKAAERDLRLKAQLRANLQRRILCTRHRNGADERLAAHNPDSIHNLSPGAARKRAPEISAPLTD